MKLVYYKHLLGEKYGLSANERIAYSNIVYQALYNVGSDVFDPETGEFDCYSDLLQEDWIEIPLYYFNGSRHCSAIARDMMLSKSDATRFFTSMELRGWMDTRTGEIMHNKMFLGGYFTLLTDTGLRGELLIFYSWLKDIAKKTNTIFASDNKLAQMLNGDDYKKQLTTVYNNIFKLKTKGYIDKDKDGHLILLK